MQDVLGHYTGAGATILDGAGRNTLLILRGVRPPGEVSGFTFRNGRATAPFHGGCLTMRNSDLTIVRNRFEKCASDPADLSSSGGAIKVSNGSGSPRSNPLIEENHFENNRSYTQGGAVHVYGATARIRRNTFRFNTAAGAWNAAGGAVKSTLTEGPPVVVAENILEDNVAHFAGGAISAFGSDVEIIGNQIRRNGHGRFGGGIHLESLMGNGGDRMLVVSGNHIEHNVATYVHIPDLIPEWDRVSGAGMHINFGGSSQYTASRVQVSGNVIRGNTAGDPRCDPVASSSCAVGGGIVFFNGLLADQAFVGNRIEANVSDTYAAGNFDKVRLVFADNVVESNLARYAHPGVGCVSGSAVDIGRCGFRRNRFVANRYLDGATGSGVANDSGALNVRRNPAEIVNNLFALNIGTIAAVSVGHQDVPGQTSRIIHNTFAGNDQQSPSFGTMFTRGAVIVHNNVFHGPTRALRMDDLLAGSSIMANNFSGPAQEVARLERVTYTSVAQLNQHALANGNTAAQPHFIGSGSEPFALSEASPLIDLVECEPGIGDDIDGSARPFGLRCDTGAFEFPGIIFASGFESQVSRARNQ